MPEAIGPLFETQVPSYTEAADIRKAFNLYHYGTEDTPSLESEILAKSMAGYIRDTLAAIDAIQEGQAVINNLGATENLNDLTTTGVYHSTASPTVGSSGLNYPTTQIGLLNFWYSSANNTYYQTYVSNGSASSSNFYWRSAVKIQATTTWGEWQLASKEGHVHDTRYFTQSQINAKISPTPTASKAAYVDSTGKVTSLDTVSATELGYLAGVTSAIQSQIQAVNNGLLLKANVDHTHSTYWLKTETAKVTVSSSQPANPSIGDLWFW